jgi:hypothetical protein
MYGEKVQMKKVPLFEYEFAHYRKPSTELPMKKQTR